MKSAAPVFVLALLLPAAAGAAGPDPSLYGDAPVEDSYKQDTLEYMIIRARSRAASREQKTEALNQIEALLAAGNRSGELLDALTYLGLEGTTRQVRENGRLINDFPDLRARAAADLGRLGTPEAAAVLLTMSRSDRDVLVLTEVVRALGSAGLNDDGEASRAIARILRRGDALVPDDRLALAGLEALEKLGSVTSPEVIQTLMSLAEGRYSRAVREKAREVFTKLKRAAAAPDGPG